MFFGDHLLQGSHTAVHTKEAGILTNPDEYAEKEKALGEVDWISFVMLGKDKEGKRKVLA